MILKGDKVIKIARATNGIAPGALQGNSQCPQDPQLYIKHGLALFMRNLNLFHGWDQFWDKARQSINSQNLFAQCVQSIYL